MNNDKMKKEEFFEKDFKNEIDNAADRIDTYSGIESMKFGDSIILNETESVTEPQVTIIRVPHGYLSITRIYRETGADYTYLQSFIPDNVYTFDPIIDALEELNEKVLELIKTIFEK